MAFYLGMVAIVFAIVAVGIFWPDYGLLARRRTAQGLAERALLEDYLKHIHSRELQGNLATVESLAGSFHQRMSRVVDQLADMEDRGLVRITGKGAVLTQQGSQMALQVIRAHRLLERYLYDELRVPLGAIHAQADRQEHTMTPAEIDALEARLGYPSHDPHGDPIPSGTGSLAALEGISLIDWAIGRPAVIIHLEDEPAAVFSQIVKSGLMTGMHIEILDVSDGQLVVWDGKTEYLLTRVAAANVFVKEFEHAPDSPLVLTALRAGESGLILGLTCEGLSRRRLLDLGFTPGAEVSYEFDAALGSPRAFRIRGTLVALRTEEMETIEIERILKHVSTDRR